jgi:hypothetical protein
MIKIYRSTAICGCECNLPEEHRLRIFESKISGRQREEITGEWRKLHNEVLRDVYSPTTFGSWNPRE